MRRERDKSLDWSCRAKELPFDYYEARAQEVKLEDITSCADNAEILHMLRAQDQFLPMLTISNIASAEFYNFVIGEGNDLGWLGYFIGWSKHLRQLRINYLPQEREKVEALMEGINRNQSIFSLIISTDLGGVSFRNLSPFLRSNNNLADLQLNFEVGLEFARSIAFALGESPCKSLTHLVFEECNLSDEGFAEIAAALRIQPQLEELRLEDNNIGSMGCITLGDTLRGWGTSKLKFLGLNINAIDDQGLQALVAGMTNTTIEELHLSYNMITAAGLRSLRTFFQSEGCSLRHLSLHGINFGDEGAVALAEGLMGNKSLLHLDFDPDDSGITDVGWAAFSKLLCDPSSINSTYLSNHTLEMITGAPRDVKNYLTWNKLGHPAICKILKSHPDLDMEPFFQWTYSKQL